MVLFLKWLVAVPIKKERDLIASQAQVPRSTLQKNAPSRADRARWLMSSGRVVVKFAVLSLTLVAFVYRKSSCCLYTVSLFLGEKWGCCENAVC
jgi:hypothetical protein